MKEENFSHSRAVVLNDQYSPLVVATCVGITTEEDSHWLDLIAKLQISCGNDSILMDFGVCGNPDMGHSVSRDFDAEIKALVGLQDAVNDLLSFIREKRAKFEGEAGS